MERMGGKSICSLSLSRDKILMKKKHIDGLRSKCTKRIMDLMFEDFTKDLNRLKPVVRQKAIEIGNELMKKEGMREEEAIKKGIVQAEEWFYDLEG